MTAATLTPSMGRTRARRHRRARVLAVPLVLVVGVAVGLAVATSGGPSSAPATVAVHPAPPFHLAAVAGGGPSVTLATAGPGPVVLSFFASWCIGCRQEMATMASVPRFAAGRVRVIGIDVNDSVGPARTLLRNDHIGYPVGADSAGTVAAAYGLTGLPTTVFLDARHRVVGETVGPISSPVAHRWVDRLAGAS